MKEIAVKDAENGLRPLFDAARKAPVRLAGDDGTVCVAMSLEQYERLRGAAWDRLAESVENLRKEAAANGLTEEKLEALLAEDS